MRFFNNDIFTETGSPIHIIYAPVVNDDGTIELKESGKENTDDIIQSYAESCDLETIIKRFEAGDLTALNRNIANYGDFTQLPKTYAEVLQVRINSERIFDSLPTDVKKEFDNDFNKFFVQTGSKEWFEKMSFALKKDKETEIVKEVIENES